MSRPPRHHVEHGELLGHAQRRIVQRQGVADDGDLAPLGPLRQRPGDDVGRRHQAVGVLMMLVDADAVEAQLVGVGEGVDVFAVEFVPLDRIVERVGQPDPGGVVAVGRNRPAGTARTSGGKKKNCMNLYIHSQSCTESDPQSRRTTPTRLWHNIPGWNASPIWRCSCSTPHSKKPSFACLPRVQTPAQYIGGELNSVVKDHRQVRGKLCLAFPDTYTLGMSHHGLQVLYTIMNNDPQWACERAFTPWLDFEAELRAARPAALQPGDLHAAARLRPDRLQPAIRGLLHERPDDARPGRHPAAQQGPHARPSAGHRRRPRRAEPGAAGPVHRPLRHRRRRGEPALDHGTLDERSRSDGGRTSRAAT